MTNEGPRVAAILEGPQSLFMRNWRHYHFVGYDGKIIRTGMAGDGWGDSRFLFWTEGSWEDGQGGIKPEVLSIITGTRQAVLA